MKQGKKSASPTTQSHRVLFFDLLRIFCILAIVYAHRRFGLIPDFNAFMYSDGFLPLNIFSAGLQGWAVLGLIFVSGAVLELNYTRITGYYHYLCFLFRRFIRIYPAFWLSLLFGLLLNILLTPTVAAGIISANWFYIIFEYTGFFVILGKGQGFINIMGWFIAAIISLYLLFPILSDFIRKYRFTGLIALMLISFTTRSLFVTYQDILPAYLWMWFPVCNVFEFCLGIYIVQTGFYPKSSHDYPLVRELADLSFYIFLFNVIIIQAFTEQSGYGLAFSTFLQSLFMQNQSLGYAVWYLSCTVALIIVSYAAMVTDRKIQECIRRNERAKKILSCK
jgi:peptidoglycan/LPS O-acetylase OafA/YrhL